MSKKILTILKKIVFIGIFIFIIICVFSCKKVESYPKIDKINDELISYDFNYFKKSKIIVPKTNSNGQMLSIVLISDNGKVIVFDGGRIEDAPYLKEIIKDNGGKVDAWFLTHIHDDHIGAIYKLLEQKDTDIKIDNLYYNFAEFEWYYEKIGNDAGALVLFEDVLKNYNENAKLNNKIESVINIQNHIKKGEIFTFDNISITSLNDMYRLDDDSINNTSIVFKATIDEKKLIIYGDLGWSGGEKLILDNSEENLNADIIVLAHHGQGGVEKNVYELASPNIAIWCTSESIYKNSNGKYKTDDTKKWLKDIGVNYNILNIYETSIIK